MTHDGFQSNQEPNSTSIDFVGWFALILTVGLAASLGMTVPSLRIEAVWLILLVLVLKIGKVSWLALIPLTVIMFVTAAITMSADWQRVDGTAMLAVPMIFAILFAIGNRWALYKKFRATQAKVATS